MAVVFTDAFTTGSTQAIESYASGDWDSVGPDALTVDATNDRVERPFGGTFFTPVTGVARCIDGAVPTGDQRAAATVNKGSESSRAGVGLRLAVGGADTGYFCVLSDTFGGNNLILRRVAGTETLLATGGSTPADTTTYDIWATAEGTTTVAIEFQGVGTAFTYDDSSGDRLQSGQPGIYLSHGGASGNVVWLDDFEVDDLAAGGGGPVEQAVAGTITPAGTLTKQVLKSASGSIAPSAALTKAAEKLFGGSTSPAGVLQRQALKVQSGSLTPAGELAAVRALLHSTAGTVTPAGALQRAPAKVAAGTITPVGALTRDVGKVAAGTVSPIGALTKASTRALNGTVTPSGALTALRSTLRAVAGTLGLSGAVTALRDVITQAVAGAIALSGTVVKRAEKQTAGTVNPSGAVTRAIWKRVDGTLEVAGTVRREVRKTFTATLPLTGVTVTVAGTFAEPGPHPLTIRFERHGKTIGFELHGKRIQFVKHQKTIDFEP